MQHAPKFPRYPDLKGKIFSLLTYLCAWVSLHHQIFLVKSLRSPLKGHRLGRGLCCALIHQEHPPDVLGFTLC